MARNESDREDLLKEATGLVPRIELSTPTEAEPVLVGIRANGSLSVYFGADPMVQFDSRGLLRRACVDSFLYRTQGSTLARLERQRTPEETILRRHDLTDPERDELCSQLAGRLLALVAAMRAGTLTIRGQVPASETPGEPTVREAVTARLGEIVDEIAARGIQLAPPIPTRRN